MVRSMNNQELKRTFTIVLVVAVVLGFLAAALYLLYGFALVWQAIAAGVAIGILLIFVLLLLAIAIYLWIRLLWLRREFRKCEDQNLFLRRELKRYKAELEQKKKKESTDS